MRPPCDLAAQRSGLLIALHTNSRKHAAHNCPTSCASTSSVLTFASVIPRVFVPSFDQTMVEGAGEQTTTTDSRSPRMRVNRSAGQALTDGLSASDEDRPAQPVFASGYPCPGRSHCTHPPQSAQQPQRPIAGSPWHPPPFIPATKSLRKACRPRSHPSAAGGSLPSATPRTTASRSHARAVFTYRGTPATPPLADSFSDNNRDTISN